MANNNAKKKTNNKSQTKKSTSSKNVSTIKKEVKKVTPKKEIKEEKKETTKVVKTTPVKVEKKVEKKGFSLTSKQKDIILIALVVVLLAIAFIFTSERKPKLDVELPVALQGEKGFTEISYSEYEEKVNNKELFLVIIVKDGCGYCEAYEPIVAEVAEEYNLPIYYINISNLSEEDFNKLSTNNAYLKKNQWGTPTTLFMYGETVVDSISGYVEKDKFVKFVKSNFKVEK